MFFGTFLNRFEESGGALGRLLGSFWGAWGDQLGLRRGSGGHAGGIFALRSGFVFLVRPLGPRSGLKLEACWAQFRTFWGSFVEF